MKKFSLKKKTVDSGKVEKNGKKKAGVIGFSLKNKNTLGTNDQGKEADDERNKRGDIEITNVDEIGQKDTEKDALVIVPSKNSSSDWEARRKEYFEQQMKQEKAEVEEKERELQRENNLEYGLNNVQKNDDSSKLTATANLSLTDIGGENPTEESYSKVPVSSFGLAMLRGMGWNEEMERERRKENAVNNATRSISSGKYQLLVGLGATPSPKVAKNRSAGYVPVVKSSKSD